MDFVFVKIGTVSECNMEISYTIEGKTVGGGCYVLLSDGE